MEFPFRTSNCVAIGVADIEAAAAHYRAVVGWEIVEEAPGWIELWTGALRIFLCADDETTPTFDLEVDDIEGATSRLIQNGWTVSPMSKEEIYVVSPFGPTFALSLRAPT